MVKSKWESLLGNLRRRNTPRKIIRHKKLQRKDFHEFQNEVKDYISGYAERKSGAMGVVGADITDSFKKRSYTLISLPDADTMRKATASLASLSDDAVVLTGSETGERFLIVPFEDRMSTPGELYPCRSGDLQFAITNPAALSQTSDFEVLFPDISGTENVLLMLIEMSKDLMTIIRRRELKTVTLVGNEDAMNLVSEVLGLYTSGNSTDNTHLKQNIVMEIYQEVNFQAAGGGSRLKVEGAGLFYKLSALDRIFEHVQLSDLRRIMVCRGVTGPVIRQHSADSEQQQAGVNFTEFMFPSLEEGTARLFIESILDKIDEELNRLRREEREKRGRSENVEETNINGLRANSRNSSEGVVVTFIQGEDRTRPMRNVIQDGERPEQQKIELAKAMYRACREEAAEYNYTKSNSEMLRDEQADNPSENSELASPVARAQAEWDSKPSFQPAALAITSGKVYKIVLGEKSVSLMDIEEPIEVYDAGIRVRRISWEALIAAFGGLALTVAYFIVRVGEAEMEDLLQTALSIVGLYLSTVGVLTYYIFYDGESLLDIALNWKMLDSEREFSALSTERKLQLASEVVDQRRGGTQSLNSYNMCTAYKASTTGRLFVTDRFRLAYFLMRRYRIVRKGDKYGLRYPWGKISVFTTFDIDGSQREDKCFHLEHGNMDQDGWETLPLQVGSVSCCIGCLDTVPHTTQTVNS